MLHGARVDSVAQAGIERLPLKAVCHRAHGFTLKTLNFEPKLHGYIDRTSVCGETSLKICSTLILTLSLP